MYALSGILFAVSEFNEKEGFSYRYINMRDKNELTTARKLKISNFIGLAAACYRVVFSTDLAPYAKLCDKQDFLTRPQKARTHPAKRALIL